MSAIATQVLESIKTTVGTTLGATFKELPFVLSLEKNDQRRLAKGYGVHYLDAADTASIVRAYSLDHRFEVVLTDQFIRQTDESELFATKANLYEKAEACLQTLLYTKAGLSALVLNVFNPTISQPELIQDGAGVALRFQLTVKYRTELTI